MKDTRNLNIVIGILFLFICTTIQAQNNSDENIKDYGVIVTDRPDQTESPTLVPKGLLQVETGFMYEEITTDNIESNTTTFNTMLLRYGLLDNLELRLGLDIAGTKNSARNSNFEDKFSGLSPLYVGFKIGITEEKGALPEIGFLGGAFLPFTAATKYKPENTGGDFRFSFAHTLSENWSFSYNLGAAWDGNSSNVSYVYTTVLGHSITEKIGCYLEFYGDFPESDRANHLIDGGFTYLVSNNIQLDLSGGTGINTDQDFFISTGISFRLPK
ncbi:hypothetical protein IMCC3317_26510 [Kordia antarctica]|uniref:Transporter n=1 Tax=Kordia antarctica TaxID=1218801 RepID=A0A7L4ZKY6_9FLAO|nr:transporter [Kordia antarctica]QHI37272.1 hypothetical protein IMCC3317_26510 [Kordia antarctica]